MAKNNNLTDFLTGVANAIRTKKGTTALINPQNFESEIASITTEQPTLNAPTIALSGDVLTIINPSTNGNFVTSFKIYNGSALLTTTTNTSVNLSNLITEEGTYTITVRASGTNFIDSNFSNSVQYVISGLPLWKTTVSNLGAENPANVSFVSEIDDNFVPWEELTFNGDTFIKFPKMYRKIVTVTSNQITSFIIANKKLDSEYELYPCFIDESGNELDYILIGKYLFDSNTQATSTSTNKVAMAIGTARPLAQARGIGYQLYDWRMHRLWQDIAMCVAKSVNPYFGRTVDNLGIHWDLWYMPLDGTGLNIGGNGVFYFSNSPTKYVDNPTTTSESYSKLSYNLSTTNGCVKELGYDSNNKFCNLPKTSITNENYDTYYGARYLAASNNNILLRVMPVRLQTGGFSIYNTSYYIPTQYSQVGNRLCYRPIQQ